MALVPFPQVDGENVGVLAVRMVVEAFTITSESLLGKVSRRKIGTPFGGRWRGILTFAAQGIDALGQSELPVITNFLEEMRDTASEPNVCEVPIDTFVNNNNVRFFSTPTTLATATVTGQLQNSNGEVVNTLSAGITSVNVGDYLNVGVGDDDKEMLVRVKWLDSGKTQVILRPEHTIATGTRIKRATVLRLRADFLADPDEIPVNNTTGLPFIAFQFVEDTF